MNERIKELALQAGLEMCSCGCDMPTRQTIEFAKLIIEKCGEIADSSVYHGCPSAYIDEYFGV